MHPLLVEGMGAERRVQCCQITRTSHRFACLWQPKNSTQLWYAPFLISWLLVTWNNMSTPVLNCTTNMSLQPIKSTRLFTAYCLSCLNYTTKYQLYHSGTLHQHARNGSRTFTISWSAHLLKTCQISQRNDIFYTAKRARRQRLAGEGLEIRLQFHCLVISSNLPYFARNGVFLYGKTGTQRRQGLVGRRTPNNLSGLGRRGMGGKGSWARACRGDEVQSNQGREKKGCFAIELPEQAWKKAVREAKTSECFATSRTRATRGRQSEDTGKKDGCTKWIASPASFACSGT